MSSIKPFRLGMVLAVVGCLPLVAFASTRRHDRNEQLHQTLGGLPAYASVGQITGSGDYYYVDPNDNWHLIDGTSFSFSASGTVIAPNLVLTAGHNLIGRDGDGWYGTDPTTVTFHVDGKSYPLSAGSPGVFPGQWYTLNKVLPEPFASLAGWDIGFMHFGEDITDGGRIKPAVLNNNIEETGRWGRSAGFGLGGTGLTGYDESSPLAKRAGHNVVDLSAPYYAGGQPLLWSDFDSPDRSSNSLAYLGSSSKPGSFESLIALGDSGGGLFISERKNTPWLGGGPAAAPNVLAGVHSLVAALEGSGDGDANSSYSDVSIHTSVSAHYDLIQLVIDLYGTSSSSMSLAGDNNVMSLWEMVEGLQENPDFMSLPPISFEQTQIDPLPLQLATATPARIITAVPEPSTLALLCMGTLALLAYIWRRRR
ncbi:MAG: PEP-CTERM sorting domain-containing protein [Planctomycetota bacterium]